jgi:aspartate/methionine/tyrosine aminotransferase
MKSSQKTFDLGFGDPVCVRETLCKMYSLPLSLIQLKDITYPNPLGNPDLVEKLSAFKDLTGNKNIVITTGANQAINLILRVLKKEGRSTISKNTPSFMYYDDIIDRSGFIRENNWSNSSDVVLLDWPSNPDGLMGSNWKLFQNDFIWDSVYNTPTYVNIKLPEPKGWRFKIGGFSKLTGLSGLRIGWIVCRDKKDLDAISYELKYENCGISSVSQSIALDVIEKLDFETFYKLSNVKINLNRDEVQKISRIFDGQKLPVNGMFYSVRANKKSLGILKKAGINFITLIEDNKEPLIRLSLGQSNSVTGDAVKTILKVDKIGGRK